MTPSCARCRCLIVTMCLFLMARTASAQLNGFNIKGDQGSKSGTQAPPGGYYGAPLYWYDADSIRDREGRDIGTSGDLNMFLGGPLVSVVTRAKVLGANYGFLAALPFANLRVETPVLEQNPGAGVSDLYIQPINLGWHAPKVDVMTGYGMYVPTGRYTAGAKDNTGLGMWGHEVFLGSTVFFDEQKAWHAATTGTFEFHSDKQDSDVHVGSLLTLEGGFGRDFLKGAVTTGLAYYAQWKLSDDPLAGPLANLLVRGKNRVAALGPEVTLPIASKQTLFGFVTVRYQWEVGARTTTQGDALNILLVMPFKPIKIGT